MVALRRRSFVEVGLKKLEEFGVPTKRPDDYIAEMLKTVGTC